MSPISPFRSPAVRTLRTLLLCLVAALVGGGAQAAETRRKIIIDDDGFGLMQMLLLEADDVEVLGLTSVSGGAWVNRETAAALRGLEILGRTDVPVIGGVDEAVGGTDRPEHPPLSPPG